MDPKTNGYVHRVSRARDRSRDRSVAARAPFEKMNVLFSDSSTARHRARRARARTAMDAREARSRRCRRARVGRVRLARASRLGVSTRGDASPRTRRDASPRGSRRERYDARALYMAIASYLTRIAPPRRNARVDATPFFRRFVDWATRTRTPGRRRGTRAVRAIECRNAHGVADARNTRCDAGGRRSRRRSSARRVVRADVGRG